MATISRLNDRAQSCDDLITESARGLKPAARFDCRITHGRLGLAGGLVPLLCSIAVGATAGPSVPDDVKANVRARVDNGFTPGVVVGVVNSDGRAYFNYGRVSTQGRRKVDENTIFEIGSITKVFTAILLTDAVHRGEVALDDPIQKYLPESVKVPARGGKMITLKDLASHRSGLPRMPANLDPTNTNNPYADYSADQLYEFLSDYTLPRDIGAMYEYSNLGGGLLGHILARVSGKSYEQLVVDRICRPLGMSDTGITLALNQRARLAKGHADGKEAGNWDFACLAGCGALRSSAKDLLTFMAANLGLEESPLTPAIRLSHGGRYSTSIPGLEVALGWHVWKKHGTEIIWHNGGTGGYHSFCGFMPRKKLGVVVLCNSTEDIDDIGLHLLEPQYELKTVKKAVQIAPEILDRYVGYYELQPGMVFHVTREEDSLFAQLTGQARFRIYPESATKFFYKVVDAQITFAKDDEDRVKQLILHQGGRDLTARKLGPEYQPPPKRVEVPIDPKVLQSYVGQYELMPGVVFDVTEDDGRLMVQITGQPRLRVYPQSETEFFYKVVDAQITFVKDEAGHVTSLILHQGGRDQTARRTK